MLFKVATFSLAGVDACQVDMEVDVTRKGLPSFSLVGLAEGAVKEARERVLAAIKNTGHPLPPARITVNLAPADRRKDGSAYDLPLALGLLGAAGLLPQQPLADCLVAGELSLSGEVRPVQGILPLAALARKKGFSSLLIPAGNAAEAAIVEGLRLWPVATLAEACAIVMALGRGEEPEAPEIFPSHAPAKAPPRASADFEEVLGQEHAKRGVVVAAAGGHNLLFIGPPGSGKTMLAERIAGILPPLAFDEALEVSKIYSVAGLLAPGSGLMQERPFRAPHHTISRVGLVGGGSVPRPGELSLAHRGVLFLDELPEFGRQTLESLRQPLEKGSVTISRAAATLEFPAAIMLVAAMNPCPCGYATDPAHGCTCTLHQVRQYRARLSGPLLDRIDLHIDVPAVPVEDLIGRSPKAAAEWNTETMRRAVQRARAVQRERYASLPLACNADLSGSQLEAFCPLGASEQAFLSAAVKRLGLSGRAFSSIRRIARTIADLAASDAVTVEHLAEAMSYRMFDREAAV